MGNGGVKKRMLTFPGLVDFPFVSKPGVLARPNSAQVISDARREPVPNMMRGAMA